jgi:hypothetical protein
VFFNYLNTSKILQNREGSVVNVVKLYNSELSSIIDKHAPLTSKNIILRPSTEWYSDELRAAKRNRRKAERAKIILRSSSLETGENDVSGSPSNFISALMVSQLSLDELFVALNCPEWYLFFQQKNHKTCQPELFHHGAKEE